MEGEGGMKGCGVAVDYLYGIVALEVWHLCFWIGNEVLSLRWVCLGKRGLLVGDAVVGSEDVGIFRFAENQVPEDLMPLGAGRIRFRNCCTDLQNVYTKWMHCEHSRYSTLSNARVPHRTLVAPLAHTCNIFMTP